MRTTIHAILAGLTLGIAGCRGDDYRNPETSPPPAGINQHGDHIPNKNSPLRAETATELFRVQHAEDEIVLAPVDAGNIDQQAGREIRLTPQEFQNLLAGDMRGNNGRARQGMLLRVIRDGEGRMSKLVVVEEDQ